MVPNNATVGDVSELGKIPLRLGRNVYIRDVASVQDVTDLDFGCALVNGKKAVYLPIIKKSTASTLTVVSDIRKSMQLFRDVVPRDVTVHFEFDESPTVRAAVNSVAMEGLIGAILTGLMILLFLRDWRERDRGRVQHSAGPAGALFGLWLTGNTINIMSLGGLALSIGILVDMSTVIIENVHVQLGRTAKVATAMLRASDATAVPILLALLCILSVFVPAFIMTDPLRALFMPLTVGVGFAMISSYLLSTTLVPILCVYLLKHKPERQRRGTPIPALALRACGRRLTSPNAPRRDRPGAALRACVNAGRLPAVGGVERPLALVRGARLPGGLLLDHRLAWQPARHRDLSPYRLGAIRAPLPAAARLELQAHPGDGCQVPPGDRPGGQTREHQDHDGIRWSGGPQLRHG